MNKQKFTFELDNISGLNLTTDKLDKLTIQIYADGLRQAQDEIRSYFAKAYLKVEKITLQKIEL